MDEVEKIRSYKDRIRIFLILYFFSEDFLEPNKPLLKKVFRSEMRIQKIDFLVRNPDYLAFELLNIVRKDELKKEEIKHVVKNIFQNNEPVLRRLEMERFFFGAYEDIDDVISFLKSIGFIDFSSKKSSDLKTVDKLYFITDLAVNKMGINISSLPALTWYVDRCTLIKKYFGDMSATQLKVAQYQIDEYRDTSYKSYIGSIKGLVVEEFNNIYNEQL